MRVKKYDLLAIGDAARLVDLSPSGMRNWIYSGDLKCLVASDGSRLFTTKQIEDFKRRRAKRTVAKLQARKQLAAMIEKAVNE